MKRQVSASAKCPYYKCEERFEIYCRGLTEGTSIHMAFSIPLDKKTYMKRHCKSTSGYCQCPVAQALEKAGAEA